MRVIPHHLEQNREVVAVSAVLHDGRAIEKAHAIAFFGYGSDPRMIKIQLFDAAAPERPD
jgi:hypothetical protein